MGSSNPTFQKPSKREVVCAQNVLKSAFGGLLSVLNRQNPQTFIELLHGLKGVLAIVEHPQFQIVDCPQPSLPHFLKINIPFPVKLGVLPKLPLAAINS